MIRFQEIRIDDVYLTSDDTSAGEEYISEVTGLTALHLNRHIVTEGINGMPNTQVRSHLGMPIDVLVPLIPTSKWLALITAIKNKETGGDLHSLQFVGQKGTFSFSAEREFVDDSGAMQDSGERDFRARFRIASVVTIS